MFVFMVDLQLVVVIYGHRHLNFICHTCDNHKMNKIIIINIMTPGTQHVCMRACDEMRACVYVTWVKHDLG